MFTHLHGHSHYSLLEAIGKISKIIDKTKELGFSAIGIADYHGMYGIMEFYTKAKKSNIKPICGIEITISDVLGKKPEQDQFIVLLAKDYEWYKNLMKITTIANTKGIDIIPTLDTGTLEQHAKWLIAILGGPRSLLGHWISTTTDSKDVVRNLSPFQAIFGSDLYLEVVAQDYTLEPSLQALNDQIISLSTQNWIPCVVGCNFHYISPKDKIAFETALAIKDQKYITDQTRRRVRGDYYIMSEQEVQHILINNWYSEYQIQERFTTNQMVVDSIDLQLPQPTPKFPLYQTPSKFDELYDVYKDMLIVKV